MIGHHRVAVAEDFLDVVGAVEQLQALFDDSARGRSMLEEAQHRLAVRRVVVPLAADIDVMRLHVEDELVLGPFLLEGLLILDLVGGDLVAVAEDLVERQQRRRHAAAGAEEVAAAQSLSLRAPAR